ncbi:hypothetical protein E6O75_ATG07466 [Venturia nashicola]|uniref:ASX DEUBAD domain-containing protein n=1 Tax=Venturia nashicola TaxID=86259 RepID=A0A4Z1PDR5_9PEZI|nr:hypothetical protein E6O75_ATG07466 [Venturia nashicola]
MDHYSLPTASPLPTSGFSYPSFPSSRLPITRRPLQTDGTRFHDESGTPTPEPSQSPSNKRREGQTVENRARCSRLEDALQQRKSASSAKLLPLAYRNDPMRVASAFRRGCTKPELSNRNYKKITSKASRLGNIDLEAFLKDDRVWNSLRPDQQQRLIERSGLEFVTDIKQLPNGKWPNLWDLAQKQQHIAIDEAVEKFQSNLRAGKLDPAWRANAKSAAVKRARGDFLRQDTPTEEDEEYGEGSSVEESSELSELEDGELLDKLEDHLDVEMADAVTNGGMVVEKIPRKLAIKIYEN